MMETTRRTKVMLMCVFIVEGAIVLTVGFATNPRVNRELFSVASQILPLLLLAVIIDLRALASRQPRAVVGLLILSFLIGEAVALAIVGNRKPVITSSWWLGLVVGSLVGLVLLIGLRSGARQADE
jgi:4-amino-4-deoxy-L-arabinose transferase-like glycosyltransferase